MLVSRLQAYGLVSSAVAVGVVYNAALTRPNFFAAAASVGQSKASLMVLGNYACFIGVCASLLFKRVFFGQLRQVESDHVFERLWIFLTESLLALATFRDDFSVRYGMLYATLMFLKCFHWISADRVDYIDQVPPPGPRFSFHARLLTAMGILFTLDILLFSYALESITFHGVSGMVVFASEFAILVTAMLATFARYMVHIIDIHRARGRPDAPAWEAKSMYMFYIDLVADFLKLFVYLIFFIVIYMNIPYGVPLQILREVYMTLRSFFTRGSELLRYRKATRNMDEQYADATAAELDRQGDRTCIICREEMIAREEVAAREDAAPVEGPNETPKKLTCGHVFHFHCLRSWLERQQICPTCRQDVLSPGGTRDRRNLTPVPAPQPAAAAQAAEVAAAAAATQPVGDQRQDVELPLDDAGLRQAYEDYFRMPAVNGDAPMPLPPRTATPRAEPPSVPQAPGPSATSHNESQDQQIQRGIWGAPIVPGQFFAPPLGAAPPLNPHEGQASAPPVPRPLSAPTDSSPVSGTTTPAASRAPVVFSPPSMGRAVSRPAVNTEEAVETEVLTESDTDEPSLDNSMARRAAADAALRRFGQTSADRKGKGRATLDVDPDAFDAPATHRAYLTQESMPLPHPLVDQVSIAQANLGRLAQTPLDTTAPTSPEAARAALDARLRALRDVDNVVWGLVGELSRLKSAWEVEDGESIEESGRQ